MGNFFQAVYLRLAMILPFKWLVGYSKTDGSFSFNPLPILDP